MRFHYIASKPDGSVVEDTLEAKDVAEVLAVLAANGWKPVSVRERSGRPGRAWFGGKVTLTDQIFLSKYLALMLKIGTGLLEAINILIADFSKPAVREVLHSVRAALEQGNPFWSTFAKYSDTFGPVYVNLVRAGEASGNLERTFGQLTQMLTKQKELKDQIKSALIYPVLLLGGAILILFFIVMFALPKIADVFLEGGFDPPAFSKAVFSIGLFFADFGFYLLGLFVAGAVAGVIALRTSHQFRRFVLSLFEDIPILRDLVRRIALQRFASILSSLISAGMPITEALEVTAQTVTHVALQDALMRISREGIAKGLTIGEAFRREPFFPATVVSLIAVSERAGHLAEVLQTLADFYVKEIDSSLKSVVSFLEPVLLVLIGAVIGVIALAIIVPIYQLTSQF